MLTSYSLHSNKIKNFENKLRSSVAITGSTNENMNLKDRMGHYKAPGVSLAIVDKQAIAVAKGYGDNIDRNTLFQAGSISKTINAVGLLSLVQQGKIDLDKDINQYLKRWQIKHNELYPVYSKITLRQILSHTAGLSVPGFQGYNIKEKIPSIVDILDGNASANSNPVEVIYKPGEKYEYSGGGTTVSQLLLEDIAGMDYASWMQENILKPFRMYSSSFMQADMQHKATTAHYVDGTEVDGKWHVYPELGAAGLWTTPSDLAKFAIAMLKVYKGNTDYPINKDTLNEMLKKQAPAEGEDSVGLGVFISRDGASLSFGHDGRNQGFISNLMIYPELDKAFVIMVNNDGANDLIKEIENAIADTYQLPGFKKTVKNVVKHVLDEYIEFPGKYTFENKTAYFKIEDNNFYLSFNADFKGAKQIFLGENGRFFLRESNYEIEYLKDSNQVKLYFSDGNVDTLDKVVVPGKALKP